MGDLLPGFQRIHIVGVGGAGMSALAKLLAAKGKTISGSDLRSSEALARLEDLGLDVWSGHRPDSIDGVDLVVRSSAVPESDPEVRAAQAMSIPVWERPRLLAALTRDVPSIGATGTHGKTTSAAMLVLATRAAGLDPSFVVGGDMLDLRTNAGAGGDPLLILEADEAFGTFEWLNLSGLMITNVELDHMDHFESVEDLEAAFVRVARNVDGPVVACLDDPGASRVIQRAGCLGYGTDEASDWRILDMALSEGSSSFRLVGHKGEVMVDVPRPGIHLARNAAGALALMAELDHDLEKAAAGLSRFQGVKRRFEHRGTVNGVSVYDDYAHHPTEVAATLRAARPGVRRRLWAVFQPHLYSRTEAFSPEFGAALANADAVVVTDVYGAREEPRPGVTGRLVADAAKRAGASDVIFVRHRADVASTLAGLLEAGDSVVIMGAGDVTVVATELLTLLEGSWV